jgi:hypothetical protein
MLLHAQAKKSLALAVYRLTSSVGTKHWAHVACFTTTNCEKPRPSTRKL